VFGGLYGIQENRLTLATMMGGGGSPLIGGMGGGGGMGGYQPVDSQGGGPPSAAQSPEGRNPYGGHPGGAMGFRREGGPLNLAFFIASVFIIIGAFFAALTLFANGSFVDFLNLTYMLLFGLTMAILDTPIWGTMKIVKELKANVGKYASFITRITGRGICFVFLGCANLSAMFANLDSVGMKIMAFILNGLVIIVGILAIVVGFNKSQKLKKMQWALKSGLLENVYAKYSTQYPESKNPTETGLTLPEFQRLATEQAPVKFEEMELKSVFIALCQNPAWRLEGGDCPEKLTKYDLMQWVQSERMTIL